MSPSLAPAGEDRWGSRLRRRFPIYGFYVGILAAFYFWIAVWVDAYLNRSWWQFTASSFSALGDPGPNWTSAAAGLYWIYDYIVLFPTAIMIMVFSYALLCLSRNRVQELGSSFFFVAGIFLMLIGIFHGETTNAAGNLCNPTCQTYGPPYPPAYHDFVSTWFFVQAALAAMTWGIGIIVERRYLLGLGMFFVILVALGGAVAIKFGSVAETEAYGIVVIDLWLAIMYLGWKPFRASPTAPSGGGLSSDAPPG